MISWVYILLIFFKELRVFCVKVYDQYTISICFRPSSYVWLVSPPIGPTIPAPTAQRPTTFTLHLTRPSVRPQLPGNQSRLTFLAPTELLTLMTAHLPWILLPREGEHPDPPSMIHRILTFALPSRGHQRGQGHEVGESHQRVNLHRSRNLGRHKEKRKVCVVLYEMGVTNIIT